MYSKILRLTGLTDVDVRSIEYRFDCDWWIVKTYNHRTKTVTGEELA